MFVFAVATPALLVVIRPLAACAAIAAAMDRRSAAQKADGKPAFRDAVVVNPDSPDAGAISVLAAHRRMPVLFADAAAGVVGPVSPVGRRPGAEHGRHLAGHVFGIGGIEDADVGVGGVEFGQLGLGHAGEPVGAPVLID